MELRKIGLLTVVLLALFTVPAFAAYEIYNNGIYNLHIDIGSAPYNEYWTVTPYGATSCTWYAQARVKQLTGLDSNGVVYGCDQWYSWYGSQCGYDTGKSLRRDCRSLICWDSHIAVVEGFTTDGKIIISEGGASSFYENDHTIYTDGNYGYCLIRVLDSQSALENKDANFKGYVYLPVAPHVDYPDGQEMTQGYDRILPDGDYLIATAANSDKASFYYLDVNGTAMPAASETLVDIAGPVAGDATWPAYETWTIKYENGFYSIKQKGTNIALDVPAASKKQLQQLWVYNTNGQISQLWAISSNLNNGYRMQVKCSGLSVDIAQGKLENGNKVWQLAYNGSDYQSWLFIPYMPQQPLADGLYTISPYSSSAAKLCVPAGGTGTSGGTKVQITTDPQDAANTIFELKKRSDGYYEVRNVAYDMAMEVYGGVSTVTDISVHAYNGSSPQLWAITPDGYNGGYCLRVKSSGYAMDLPKNNATSGTVVRQNQWNGSMAETWVFTPVTTNGDLVLPNELKQIDAEAFAGIAASVVRIPQGCTSIGSGAFRDCPNLVAIYIPETVTYIANNAFQNSSTVKIYGKNGSYAIQYAQQGSIPYSYQ